MDSDDEYILEHEAKIRSDFPGFPRTRRYIGSHPVRLYEAEENYLVDAWISAGKEETHDSYNDPPSEHGVQYRTLRFFAAMKGFHTGSLDLAGRHARRYRSIQRRWKDFALELEELLEHTTETQAPMLDHLGRVAMLPGDPPEPLMEISFRVDPDDMRRDFEQKWKLRLYNIGAIRSLYEDVKKCLEINPTPKLQKLCVLDLPPELLHHIVAACNGDDARQLGMTCHKLRAISLPFIYQERRLELDFKPNWTEVSEQDVSAIHEYVRSIALAARDKFAQDVAFLQTRPDITNRIEKLSILGWSDYYYEMAGWQRFDEDVVEYLLPISVYVQDLITCSPNIKKLSISSVVITQPTKQSILGLQNLNLLRLVDCKVTGPDDYHHPLSSARNLFLRITDPLDASQWTFMPALPNLRWLSLSGSEHSRPLPSTELINQRNPFVTVERALFDGVQPDEWDDLVSMFSSAAIATNHRLPLTRLKISLTYGLPDTIFRVLLAALEGSALERLVVNGLESGEPAIIDDIADKLPDLKSLTLAYRDSSRQCKSKAARWPRPTWEYAQRLRRLHRLVHFGWNLDVTPTPLPAVMTHFEDGYPGDWWKHVQDDWPDPSNDVAKLLAAYCPTLEMVVFLHVLPVRYLAISHSPEGAIRTDASFSPDGYFENHDPNFVVPWPLVGSSDAD